MNNILFLVDKYYPKPSINGICCDKVADELIKKGYNVFFGSYKTKQEDEQSIGKCSFSIGILKNDDYHISLFKKASHYIKWLLPFRKFPAVLDHRKTKQIVKSCDEIIKENKIDTIVCAFFTMEILVAGKLMKQKYPNIRFVAYLLDPFYGGFVPKLIPKKIAYNKNKKWEHSILSAYDTCVLMNSARAIHDGCNYFDDIRGKMRFLDVPLFSFCGQKNCSLNNGKINVFFCGLLEYPRRNIKFIIDLISFQNNPNIVYYFAGKTNRIDLFKNSGENVVFLDEIDHDKVVDYLEKSDIFLNLGVTTSSAISGKIFEYMSYGKPIISTYSIDDEACIEYLNDYPYALLIDERKGVNKNQSTLLSSFILENYKSRVDKLLLNKKYYRNTPQAFVDVLENELLKN